MGLLAIGFAIAYVDRSSFSVALASPDFKAAFPFSPSQRGNLNSAFFWSYALLQIPAGYLTDRFGVRMPYGLSFLFWSVAAGMTALAGSFWQLFALRLLLGVGEAVVTPASLRWIRLHFPERQRGLATGMLFAGAKLGPAAGTWLATDLLLKHGWQAMFLILGLGSLIFLVPWFLLVKDDDRQLEAVAAKASTHQQIPFSAIWHTPAIYGIILGTIAYNYFNYFCLTWLPSYFVEQWKLSMQDMRLFTTFSFLGMAFVAVAAGAAADALITRGWDVIKVRKGFTIAGLAVASTEIIGVMSGSRDVALTFAIISLAGLGLSTANYWALTQSLMPGAAIGRIAGVQNLASNMAGIIAPIVTGYLIEITGSYEAPMQAVLAVLLMGVLAYTFLVRKQYAPHA